MGKQGNVGKTAAKEAKQASRSSHADKDRTKANAHAVKLAVRQEKNRQRKMKAQEKEAPTPLTPAEVKEKEENRAKALEQMRKDRKDRKTAKQVAHREWEAKRIRDQQIIDNNEAKAKMEEREAAIAEEYKRKHTYPTGYFPDSRLMPQDRVDPATSSPLRKKPKGDGTQDPPDDSGTVYIIDELEQEAVAAREAAVEQEAAAANNSVVTPVPPPSILKKTMLQAAAAGIPPRRPSPEADAYFQPRNGSTNRERIPPSEFANKVFIETTIMVTKKPADFVGTDMKWALHCFTTFFSQAQEDLGTTVSLILLSYFMSSATEPEAIKNTKKMLNGTANKIKKHAHQFRVNTKEAGKGRDYPMYIKCRIGTNVFGEDLKQLLDDLKCVASNVTVYKAVLQKPEAVVLSWLVNSHRTFDVTWLSNWTNNICVQLHAGTCKHTLLDLDKAPFMERDPIELGFQWRPVYVGKNKKQREESGMEQTYAVHVLCEKKDKTLATALMRSLLACPAFSRVVSLEFRMAPTFQNDNGPAERLKLLETVRKHKHVQDKITSVTIPELDSLDVRAPPTTEQKSTVEADDSSTTVAEKKNPTARNLIMRLEKKGMEGVKLFTDVGTNWNGTEHVATCAEIWKDEGRFVASNIAAYLFKQFGEVGLSFFPDHVGKQVKAQGWNEEEDRPVTAGEEALDYALKPYAKNSVMNKMFDFSKMDDTPLKQDLQNPGGRPLRNDDKQATDRPPDLQRIAYRDALSLASQAQSEYYNPDGTPRATTQRAKVSFGDDTTLGSGIGEEDDMFSINTNEHLADNATEMDVDDNASADGLLGSGASASSNKTSVSQRSAGSLAREQDFASEREKFNAELNRVKERNRQEREDQEAATVAAAERVRQEQAEQQAVIANLQQQMALLQATQASSGAEEPPPPD